MRTFATPRLLVALLMFLLATSTHAQAQNTKKKRRSNPAMAPIKVDPALPNVLLIGDSISIGYTVATRELLKGKANVHRIPTNGGDTKRGMDSIDQWLGDRKWDVIHFNWGLHDLKFIDGKQPVPLEQYEKNLRTLVSRLRKTNAQLVWCATTPVPEGVSPPRKDDDVRKYNTVAAEIAKKEGVAVNDLYEFARPKLEQIQRPKNVHFSPEGSSVLASQVARCIREALKR